MFSNALIQSHNALQKSVQPMYTQRLENPHNALRESRAEWIPASRQKMAPAAKSSILLF